MTPVHGTTGYQDLGSDVDVWPGCLPRNLDSVWERRGGSLGPATSTILKYLIILYFQDVWPYLPVVCADSWLGWDSWHHQHLPRTMSQEEDQLASLPWSAGVEAGLVAMVCDHSCALHPRLWSGSAAKILEITFVSRRERLNDLCCVNLYL